MNVQNKKKQVKKQNPRANRSYDRSKSYGTKPNSKGKGRASRYEVDDEGTDPRNDVSWYTANPELLKDAASFPYAKILGLPLQYNYKSDVAFGNTKGYFTVPGIMSFETTAIPGISRDASSAINMSARALYSYVRHQNSGSKNYESADLFMYVLALDSAYTFWAEMNRVYGLVNRYRLMNRYYPKAMFKAIGVDFDSIQSNMADFRYYINQYAYKLASLAVPSGFDLFKRHIWLFGNYFVDSDSAKAQTFVFKNVAHYVFSGRTDEAGSELIRTARPSTDLTFDDFISIGNTILKPLIEDEDIGIMSGDILKAFGRENLLTLNTINSDFTVDPIYSIEVLSQIQNASVGFSVSTPTTWNVTQNNGTIILDPRSTGGPVYGVPSIILNMYKDDPTPADTMVATRLSWVTTSRTNEEEEITLKSCGTEIIHTAKLWFNSVDSAGKIVDTSYTAFSSHWQTEMGDSSGDIYTLAQVTSFRFHPLIYNYMYDADSATDAFIGILGDLNNYTVLDGDDLETMHEAALLSLVDCKNMGNWSRKFN